MGKLIDKLPVGIALIGAGMIAKSHVQALSAIPERARLKAVVSQTPERAEHLAAYYNGPLPQFTADLAAVAADPSIAVAIVATPPSVRSEVIATLAAAGKHILLEKPVGRTAQEALEVVEICEAAGVVLGILFQHRARAPSIEASRLVANAHLGKLGVVEIEVPLWRDQNYYDELGRGTYARDGGGVIITNGIHSLDLALSLAGPVISVQAMIATSSLHRMEAEDFAVAGFQFASGAVGSFVASTAMYPHRTEVIRLHFDNASLKLDKDALEISWRDGRSTTEAQDPPKQDTPKTGPPVRDKYVWHQAVIEDFIRAVQTNRQPMVSGRQALSSHRLIEAIENSSRTGRSVKLHT